MATVKKKEEKKVTASNAAAAKPVKAVKAAAPKKVAVKKVEAKVEVATPKAETKSVASFGKAQDKKKSLSIDVYDLAGKVTGKVSIPAEMFGEKVNKTLLAQAVRVYRANLRQGNASTKTRGEVDGSTRKIYRQKGTGRARHGSIRAPIFVKGGVVFGPRPRDFSLELPIKMKRKALFCALSAKLKAGEIKVVAGLEEIKPKTKDFVTVLQKLDLDNKKRNVLIVTAGKTENVKRASGNVVGVLSLPCNLLNAYEVIKSKNLIVMKDALVEMEKTFLGKKSIRQAQDK